MSRHPNTGKTNSMFVLFQSRAGFSECLDDLANPDMPAIELFQSRAGFSECLDFLDHGYWHTPIDCFNPVLGFLSVSTSMTVLTVDKQVGFNPVLGFLSVSTSSGLTLTCGRLRFNPVLGFLSVSTGGEYTVIGVKSLSQCSKSNPRYVDWGCTET